MTIVALEPNPTQAEIIRRIVSDLAPVEFTLVRCGGELLRALTAHTPDLVLLPALLSPADEVALFAWLRTLPDSAHLEMLITSILGWPDDEAKRAPRGVRRWWPHRSSPSRFLACDPRLFSDQLKWSLQAADEARRERENRLQLAERRVHRRFTAAELPGVRIARFKQGPLVKLVDFSAGGVLLETEAPLRPESEARLELVGESLDSVVPLRIVRCQVSSAENHLRYFGGCSFARPLDLTELRRPPSGDLGAPAIDSLNRFDIVVKAIVEQRGSRTLRSIVMSLQEAGRLRPFDPVARVTNDLLAAITSTLEQYGERAVTVALIEDQLRAVLPSLTVRFASAPSLIAAPGREPLFLRVSTAGSAAQRVLNVELPQGSTLEDWQFRLLKASTYIAACLPTAPEVEIGARADPLFSQSMIA